jgi:hypothetical protein
MGTITPSSAPFVPESTIADMVEIMDKKRTGFFTTLVESVKSTMVINRAGAARNPI